jgi:hypothetical protein
MFNLVSGELLIEIGCRDEELQYPIQIHACVDQKRGQSESFHV